MLKIYMRNAITKKKILIGLGICILLLTYACKAGGGRLGPAPKKGPIPCPHKDC